MSVPWSSQTGDMTRIVFPSSSGLNMSLIMRVLLLNLARFIRAGSVPLLHVWCWYWHTLSRYHEISFLKQLACLDTSELQMHRSLSINSSAVKSIVSARLAIPIFLSGEQRWTHPADQVDAGGPRVSGQEQQRGGQQHCFQDEEQVVDHNSNQD